MRVRDRRFTFRDLNDRTACCHVRIIHRGDSSFAVVIASELANNEGMALCNAFETLMPQLVDEFDLDPTALCYIEHWGPFSYSKMDRAEEFARVFFTYVAPQGETPGTETACGKSAAQIGMFINPSWEVISQAALEELIGMELPPFPFHESV